jgi:acetolactate synthase-1/2/3 large subunit
MKTRTTPDGSPVAATSLASATPKASAAAHARPLIAADQFVACLENEGVEYVFGIPGEETLDINEALERSAQITFVPTRHEQGAAFMAEAYGRLTGKAGVCLATLGPGATNLATGIADANLDHAPVVAITGQVDLSGMHKETHQFIDIVEMMQPMTKWNARVHDPRTVAEAVRKAFSVATAEKPGATHLELPADVMASPVVSGRCLQRTPQAVSEPDDEALRLAAGLIREARRPVLLVGHGVVRQGAAPALRELCRQTGLHVITTFMGKGVLDSGDPYFLFTAGLNAQNYPAGLFGRADLVVCVGYDLVEWAPSAWNPDGDRRIVCIDTVTPDIDAHYVPEVELIGDLTHIVVQLGRLLAGVSLPALEVPPYHRAFEGALDVGDDDDALVKPQRVLRDLRELMATDDILVSDVGAHKLWVARFWEASEPKTVLMSNGFAAMGFGLPAAIAAALIVRGQKKVAAIVGDGGFLMNVGELETAKRLGHPLVVLIWRDGSYGLIEMHQRRQFGHVTGTRFGNPDFVALAQAFGLQGFRVERAGELTPVLREAFAAPGPVIVEIPIDYRENDKLGIDLWQLAPDLRH